MADDNKFSGNPERSEGGPRGGRPSGGRDLGGFRIRLSDNEMQAARALQEAFQLRSTVAVLGFSVRTLAQMLEEGQLDALVAARRQFGSRLFRSRSKVQISVTCRIVTGSPLITTPSLFLLIL